jgi:hypothetical protein
MSASIFVRYQCPRCQVPNHADAIIAGDVLNCRRCDWRRSVGPDDLPAAGPRRCLVCGNEDLWRQKDFPQAMGLMFVAIGAVGSLVAWYYHRPIIALGILLSVAAIDFLLFALMPDVLVCYRCQARHRGGDISERPTFDHETAERYRQEQLRREQGPALPHPTDGK